MTFLASTLIKSLQDNVALRDISEVGDRQGAQFRKCAPCSIQYDMNFLWPVIGDNGGVHEMPVQ
jgi:hypothetical protein